MAASPKIQPFFDEATNTVTYLVIDPESRRAAVIDPVLDYDHRSGKASVQSIDRLLAAAKASGAIIDWVLESHVHADHLSAASYIKRKTGARVGIGEHVRDVQKIFRAVFNAQDVSLDGAEFDHLFRDGERFKIGGLDVEVVTSSDASLGQRALESIKSGAFPFPRGGFSKQGTAMQHDMYFDIRSEE